MPTPLSAKVSVLASGSSGDLNGERRAVGDKLRIGEQFVAQLLASVGGVGDEFADEDVALGIDGMHHQVQEPRNVGFKTLRFRGGGL